MKLSSFLTIFASILCRLWLSFLSPPLSFSLFLALQKPKSIERESEGSYWYHLLLCITFLLLLIQLCRTFFNNLWPVSWYTIFFMNLLILYVVTKNIKMNPFILYLISKYSIHNYIGKLGLPDSKCVQGCISNFVL